MKPTVVVVDDEAAIVEAVSDLLDEADVAVVPCLGGEAAHACISRVRPDAVILDVQMPCVDGITVFRHLRNDPATRGIPVIFFTANADKLRQHLPDYHALGAELLPKPFHVDALLALVRRVILA